MTEGLLLFENSNAVGKENGIVGSTHSKREVLADEVWNLLQLKCQTINLNFSWLDKEFTNKLLVLLDVKAWSWEFL